MTVVLAIIKAKMTAHAILVNTSSQWHIFVDQLQVHQLQILSIIMPTAVACKYADAAMMSGFIIHGDITILQIDNVVHFVRLSPLFLVFSAISNGVSTERIVRADGWQELPWLAYKTIYCSDNAS